MREQPDAAAEKRAEAVRFAQREQMQHVHPRNEIVHIVQIAQCEAFEQRAFELERPQRMRRHRAPVGEREHSVVAARHDGGFLVGGGEANRTPGAKIDRDEGFRIRGKAQRVLRAREFHHQHAAFECGDASDA
jgi:hypothetical protein